MVPGADSIYRRVRNGGGTGGRIERVLLARSARAILPPVVLRRRSGLLGSCPRLVSCLPLSPARRASSASSCGRTLAGFRGAGSILHRNVINGVHLDFLANPPGHGN